MSQLLNPERGPYTDAVQIDFRDLIALGTGNSLQIGVIPPGGAVSLVSVTKTIAVVGSTSTVFNIGTTGADPDEFIDALDADGMTLNVSVFNTGDLMVQAAGTTTTLGGYLPVKAVATATPIYLKLTDSAVASMTAGEWVIAMAIIDPLKFNVK